MGILLVEDDYLQSEMVLPVLRKEFPGVAVTLVKTEHQFRQRLNEIVASRPDLAIFDMMVRWSKPSPNPPPTPRDVHEGGSHRAGLRCERLLSDHLPGIPVIFFTILEQADLKPDELPNRAGIAYLTKQADPVPLVRAVRQLIGHGKH